MPSISSGLILGLANENPDHWSQLQPALRRGCGPGVGDRSRWFGIKVVPQPVASRWMVQNRNAQAFRDSCMPTGYGCAQIGLCVDDHDLYKGTSRRRSGLEMSSSQSENQTYPAISLPLLRSSFSFFL